MSKKSCFVFRIITTFPSYHKRAGEETNFVEMIKQGTKKHTIVVKYDHWKKICKLVDENKAYISLRIWEGVACRSSTIEIMRLHRKQKVGIESLEITDFDIFVDNKKYVTFEELAEGEGLSVKDFKDLIQKHDLSKTLGIFHFKSTKYTKVRKKYDLKKNKQNYEKTK